MQLLRFQSPCYYLARKMFQRKQILDLTYACDVRCTVVQTIPTGLLVVVVVVSTLFKNSHRSMC